MIMKGFPVLGVFANPVKGSVVMWDNLKKNGADRDTRTWHGGCPVVLGVKWSKSVIFEMYSLKSTSCKYFSVIICNCFQLQTNGYTTWRTRFSLSVP